MGRFPNPIFTDSPSSSTVSSSAWKLKVRPVWPALNVTEFGTSEWSSPDAPPWLVRDSGIVTVRSGSALRVTVMFMELPSATV